MLKNLKPIFIKSPKLLKLLSKIAPIEIGAIALFPFVFTRSHVTEVTKRHETIHFQQQLELGIIPFYLIYLWDYFKIRKKGYFGWIAYMQIRAEREAHLNDTNSEYLQKRVRWEWLKKGQPNYS